MPEVFRISRDYRIFQANRRPQPLGRCCAVGLDLGINTGYGIAYFDPDEPLDLNSLQIFLGQLSLDISRHDTGAIRQVRLRAFLRELEPDLILYEDVKYTPPDIGRQRGNASAIASRVYGPAEFLGTLKSVVAEYGTVQDIPCEALPIGAIKKRATGKGNASKEAVITACNEEFGLELEVDDYKSAGTDNVADATYALVMGLETYAKGVTGD